MVEIILFAISRIFTKAFWYFVLCSFVGVLLLTFRNSFRTDIFKEALDWSKSGRKIQW